MSKPKFNPNLPYEATKPKFDPSQPFETAEDVSQLESAIRGIVQGVSLGFADEITGALEAAISDKTYAQARDESRKKYEEAKASNPITYGAGEIGGAIGTALIPGLGGATLGKLTLQGAAQGLGNSKADLTDPTLDNMGRAAVDTAIGAGTGVLAAGAAKAIPAAGGLIKRGLEGVAESPLLAKVAKMQPGPRAAEKAIQYLDLADPVIVPKAAKALNEMSKAEFDDFIKQSVQRTTTGMRGMTPAGQAMHKAAEDTVIEAAKPRSAPSILDMFRGEAPSTAGKSLGRNVTEQVGGRLGAYGAGSIPFVGGVPAGIQAASDAALITKGGAQLGLGTVNYFASKLSGKYAKVLTDAAQRGGNGLASSHFILQQTDPQYREEFRKAQEEPDNE